MPTDPGMQRVLETQLLAEYQVLPWEDPQYFDWYEVQDSTGPIAHFEEERDAQAFRLMKINLRLNG